MKEELAVSKRPGGSLAARQLHYFWILDVSSSMASNGKIQSLNNSIRDAIPLIRKEADNYPNAKLFVRVIKFSSGAQWHIAQPTPIADFKWTDLSANGVTDMGKAFLMVSEQLAMPPMPERGLPPVLALLSDGQPTDDFESGIRAIMAQPWGKKSIRVSIAIGGDANLDVLQKFIGHAELQPLRANNPEALAKCIKWVSTIPIGMASAPPINPGDPSSRPKNKSVPIPLDDGGSKGADVW
jgi:uncharacterized protein YegL